MNVNPRIKPTATVYRKTQRILSIGTVSIWDVVQTCNELISH